MNKEKYSTNLTEQTQIGLGDMGIIPLCYVYLAHICTFFYFAKTVRVTITSFEKRLDIIRDSESTS